MNEIKRLEQELIEDEYSKRYIKETVVKDLQSLQSHIDTCITSVNTYRKQNYYESKNIRVNQLTKETRDIVTHILTVVLPKKHPEKIQAIVGEIASYLNYEDIFDGVKTSAELLAIMSSSNLFTLKSTRDGLSVTSNVELDKDVYEFIDKTMYLPPLICEPNQVKCNTDTGYLNSQGSLILNGGHHDNHISLDVINQLSRIPLALNKLVEFEEELPEPKKVLTTIQEQQRQETFYTQRDISETVQDNILNKGNKFYFTWKFDSRGRVYSQGYHINIQANSYKKACIELHNKQTITLE